MLFFLPASRKTAKFLLTFESRFLLKTDSGLRVEFLLKTDSEYPKDTGVNKPFVSVTFIFWTLFSCFFGGGTGGRLLP